MSFVMGLLVSTNGKADIYNSILIIIDKLIKMVHYEPVKVTIDIPGLTKIILDVVIQYHGLLNSIISDWGSVFTSKFWSLLCYFQVIKQRLSIVFYPQTDSQTKRQNSTMKVYLRVFVNYK